jgi:hypothetical protein
MLMMFLLKTHLITRAKRAHFYGNGNKAKVAGVQYGCLSIKPFNEFDDV